MEPAVKKKAYWTLLPIGAETVNGHGYSHVLSGVFQLPLVEGPVLSSVLEAQSPYEELLRVLSQKKSPLKLCESAASILVRVMNPLLSTIQKDTLEHWQEHISTSFLQEMVAAASESGNSTPTADHYTYDMSRFYGGKSIEKQFSKTPDIKKLMKNVNVIFSEATHIAKEAM